jgi:excisionase family DNA binding protein
MNDTVYITVGEASKKFNLTRPYIYNLIKQGKVASIKDEKETTLVSVEELKEVSKKKKKKSKKNKEVVTEVNTPMSVEVKETTDFMLITALLGVAIIGGIIGYTIANLLK